MHTAQSMHSSGSMTSMFGPSLKQSTGQTSTQSVYLHLMHDSVTTWVMGFLGWMRIGAKSEILRERAHQRQDRLRSAIVEYGYSNRCLSVAAAIRCRELSACGWLKRARPSDKVQPPAHGGEPPALRELSMKFQRSLFRAVLAQALLLGTLSVGPAANAQDAIKLGELNSYKVFPAFLEPYRKGMELAVEQTNAAGGIFGRKLEVVFR